MTLKELIPLINTEIVVYYKDGIFINGLKYFENKEVERIEIDDFYDNTIAVKLKED